MTRKRTRKKVVRSRLGWVIERARTLGFKVDHAMSWESVGLACGATGVRNKIGVSLGVTRQYAYRVGCGRYRRVA